MNNPRKVRWLIAHQPQDLFVRTAKAFKEELVKQGLTSIDLEILTYPEYCEKYTPIAGLELIDDYNNENFGQGYDTFWKALEEGDIEMSQTQVGRIGDRYNDFDAIDLPFIFDNHDHVSRVLEGEIGQELCSLQLANHLYIF